MVLNQLNRPVSALILDWAGTTIDFGSLAPTQVFVELFRQRGVEITVDEARGPMGKAKRDHILAIASLPRVVSLWHDYYGRPPESADIDDMYEAFLPLQKRALIHGSDVIPGIPEAIEQFRRHGLKIGSSTGYTRELMDVVVPIAAGRGYSPDVIVCADDVPAGRPAPWMNFLAAQKLGVYPMDQILVVDDTVVGIEAGLNAGAITVGVTKTGNELGLSEAEVAVLSQEDLAARLAIIEHKFKALGAHFTVASVADLPRVLGITNQ